MSAAASSIETPITGTRARLAQAASLAGALAGMVGVAAIRPLLPRIVAHWYRDELEGEPGGRRMDRRTDATR